MEITILGSGTATPSLDRNASGLMIRAAETWALVDMGPGTLRRMCEAGIDARLIDLILITHFHPDHVSDLAPFLFASKPVAFSLALNRAQRVAVEAVSCITPDIPSGSPSILRNHSITTSSNSAAEGDVCHIIH